MASRAAGLVALALVTTSAALALVVASRLVRRPDLSVFHRQTAVLAVFFIGLHGVTLLGDRWLHPSPVQIAAPFLLPYRPLWTGLGIIAGYLVAIFGLSFYIRGRVGARFWRNVHRLMIIAFALAVAHTLGAGTDSSTIWLRAWIALSLSMLLVLSALRVRLLLRGRRPVTGRESTPTAGRVLRRSP